MGVPAAKIAPVVVDAAGRAGVTPDQVKVVSAETMTFPDGSLGCPEPGMAYTQMVVDGFKIVAQAKGVTYDYRGTANGFRLCSKTPSEFGSSAKFRLGRSLKSVLSGWNSIETFFNSLVVVVR